LYDHYEVMSALRKEVKLGDVAAAIYWLNVLLTHGGKSAPALVAKQLWIMAAEDVDDPATVLRAFAVLQMAGRVGEIDHLVFLTAAMCRARKWWQHDDGREVDRAWSQAIGDLKRSPREILDFALQGEQVELQHPDIARLPELCPEEAARESLDPI
jgi:replication-associated recombination protein RarA